MDELLKLKLGEIKPDDIKNLLKCPIKRQMILEIVTTEKSKIEAYEQELEQRKNSPATPTRKKPKTFESPIALLRRRMLEKRNQSKDEGEESDSRNPPSESSVSPVPSPVNFCKILEGVIAFVEVKTGENDRSKGIKFVLESMGATIRDRFLKDVTHVIYKEGSVSTYQKAKFIGAKLVSVLWVEACKVNGRKASENDYPAIRPIGLVAYDPQQSILCSQYQKDYEEVVRDEFDKSVAAQQLNEGTSEFCGVRKVDFETEPLINGCSFSERNRSVDMDLTLIDKSGSKDGSLGVCKETPDSFLSSVYSRKADLSVGDVDETVLTSNISVNNRRTRSMSNKKCKSLQKSSDGSKFSVSSNNLIDSNVVNTIIEGLDDNETCTEGARKESKGKKDSGNVETPLNNRSFSKVTTRKKKRNSSLVDVQTQENTSSTKDGSSNAQSVEKSLNPNDSKEPRRITLRARRQPITPTDEPTKPVLGEKLPINKKTKTKRKLFDPEFDSYQARDNDDDLERSKNRKKRKLQTDQAYQLNPSILLSSNLKTKLLGKENSKQNRTRQSASDFQPASSQRAAAKRKLKVYANNPTIVYTKMDSANIDLFEQVVRKLGRFAVEDEVSSRTTHLVVGEPKRTINMLRAITMGCWVLRKEWLLRSLEAGRWVEEEDYEVVEFSPAVQACRLMRQAFGPFSVMDIFEDCGPIYVYLGSIPRCSDLRELVVACKGKITKVLSRAAVVVGQVTDQSRAVCVSEKWILDSITANKMLPLKDYLLQK
ncbi:unnamed protein product [Phyllotreta striolata]|uniref:BRCT domain-containing protein n=1 Tax=Phyllotreta striolata TaxID=444603 RepID=A0A9N9TX66_PHYSR|nr:unnamed protein product [Phyllotreta striolata]